MYSLGKTVLDRSTEERLLVRTNVPTEENICVLGFALLCISFAPFGIIVLCLLLLVVGGSLVVRQRLQSEGDTDLVGLLQADTLLHRHGERTRRGG